MSLRTALFSLVATACLAGAAQAQKGDPAIPKDFRPPPGMCRIWLDKVPPRQQPAPTTCPQAVRNRPPNGRVIFGDDYVEGAEKGDKKDVPFLKKFGEEKPKP